MGIGGYSTQWDISIMSVGTIFMEYLLFTTHSLALRVGVHIQR